MPIDPELSSDAVKALMTEWMEHAETGDEFIRGRSFVRRIPAILKRKGFAIVRRSSTKAQAV